jgi:hypothetical protein
MATISWQKLLTSKVLTFTMNHMTRLRPRLLRGDSSCTSLALLAMILLVSTAFGCRKSTTWTATTKAGESASAECIAFQESTNTDSVFQSAPGL